MASRRAVLLTPSLSSRPVQPLSCTQITRETPLIPIFVFKSLRTLSFSVSCKSCVCHSYANGRGGYQQFPTWSESLAACNPSLTSINRPPLVRCVDSSSPLQLSTFNRVSFPSSRLTLSQRSAKSFTIRTSKTPLPQLLYNPHLQAPLGSAGNKGLITSLESALTKNSPVTSLESALTKTGGWRYGVSRSAKNAKLAATRKERCQDLIWPEAASQVTAARRKYDSLAMWHASAALWPKTASSVTGWRFFTPWKNFQRWGFSSSQETPR